MITAPVQEQLLSLGDWRHPGVYAAVHLPSGLEYVGASACVLNRVRSHLRGSGVDRWRHRLSDLTGEGFNRDQIVFLWLETCRCDAESIRHAEQRHYELRCPRLNAERYKPYGMPESTGPLKGLGNPPPPMDLCHITAAQIQLQLKEIWSADRAANVVLSDTRWKIRGAIGLAALMHSEAAYEQKANELCSGLDPSWGVRAQMGAALLQRHLQRQQQEVAA